MKKFYNGFKLAFSFLTPIPFKSDYSKKNLGIMIYFFPLVGLFAGAVIFLFANLMINILPKNNILFVSLFSVIILLFLDHMTNNFLHIDGFCDTVDALYFTKKNKNKFKILKDSHIGMYAAFWLFTLLLIKFLVFYYYLVYYKKYISILPEVLLIYPVMGYLIVPYLIFYLKPIFTKGLGASLKQAIRKKHLIINLFVSMILIFLFLQYKGMIIFILCHILMIILILYFKKKFNGYNGDVLGFCIEVVRISVLTMVLIGVEILKII